MQQQSQQQPPQQQPRPQQPPWIKSPWGIRCFCCTGKDWRSFASCPDCLDHYDLLFSERPKRMGQGHFAKNDTATDVTDCREYVRKGIVVTKKYWYARCKLHSCSKTIPVNWKVRGSRFHKDHKPCRKLLQAAAAAAAAGADDTDEE